MDKPLTATELQRINDAYWLEFKNKPEVVAANKRLDAMWLEILKPINNLLLENNG